MKKVWKFLFVVAAVVAITVPGMSAMAMPPQEAYDPVAFVDEALTYWVQPNGYIDKFEATADKLSGPGLYAQSEIMPEIMIKRYGQLTVNFIGNGVQKSYDWKNIVMGNASMMNEMSNDDFKKLIIILADRQAEANKMQNPGRATFPTGYYLTSLVYNLGAYKKTMPLYEWLIVETGPDIHPEMRQPVNPNTQWGRFWSEYLTGNGIAALNVIREVPSSRLGLIDEFRKYAVWLKTRRG